MLIESTTRNFPTVEKPLTIDGHLYVGYCLELDEVPKSGDMLYIHQISRFVLLLKLSGTSFNNIWDALMGTEVIKVQF